jgi:hypothetical protein
VVTDNRWHHVALTYDEANTTLKIYLDGVLEDTLNTQSTTSLPAFTMSDEAAHTIELSSNTSADASIDDVRFWSTERTLAQIQDSMNEKLTGTEAGLEALWQFEDGTHANVVEDKTGKGHDATIDDTGTTSARIEESTLELNEGNIYIDDQPISGTAFGEDAEGDSIDYSVSSQPLNGTASILYGEWTYTPINEDISQPDQFIIRASDGQGGIREETILLRGENSVEGDSANNNLTGSSDGEVLLGRGGDDTLDGGLGSDILEGGTGDDTLIYDGTDLRVDGGEGYDTLQLLGTNEALDLTNLSADMFSGIEKIDMTGAGNNTLSLEANDLLDFSGDITQLLVVGDTSDYVDMGAAADWTLNSDSSFDLNGTTYNTDVSGLTTIGADSYVSYLSVGNLDMLILRPELLTPPVVN